MKRTWIVIGLVVGLLLGVAATSPLAARAPALLIPFDGMSNTYDANVFGNAITSHRVVLLHDQEENTVILRSDQTVMEVDVATREILWATDWPWGEYQGGEYVEDWIPTDVQPGDVVLIGAYEAQVVGSRTLAVEGHPVETWELHASYERADEEGNSIYGKVTWYHDKVTGLWIAGTWAEFYDEAGWTVIGNWGGHLSSSNVLIRQDTK